MHTPFYCDPMKTTLDPLDLHREIRSRNMEKTKGGLVLASDRPEMPSGEVLDITTWLPYASKKYLISPDIEDYVLVPVVTVPVDFPNRNGVGFPLENLLEFLPDEGMMSYKTWKGKPTFLEHDNKKIKEAKGVIADTFLKRIPGYGLGRAYKLVKLLCFDRTKDPALANAILKREINSYSMGAYATSSTCSYCGKPAGKCPHIYYRPDKLGREEDMKRVYFYEHNGHIVHLVMKGIRGFETSAVATPAWVCAISDYLMPVRLEESNEPDTSDGVRIEM